MNSASIKIYERIIEIDEDNPGAYYGIAIIEERLGNEDKALEYYNKAIEKTKSMIGPIILLLIYMIK